MAKEAVRMKPRIRWIARIGLWDCTNGVIHGGGETPQLAYADYIAAIMDEWFDA